MIGGGLFTVAAAKRAGLGLLHSAAPAVLAALIVWGGATVIGNIRDDERGEVLAEVRAERARAVDETRADERLANRARDTAATDLRVTIEADAARAAPAREVINEAVRSGAVRDGAVSDRVREASNALVAVANGAADAAEPR